VTDEDDQVVGYGTDKLGGCLIFYKCELSCALRLPRK